MSDDREQTQAVGQQARRYLEAIVGGDTRAAASVTAAVARQEPGLAGVYLNIFAPALVRVGQLWAVGRLTAAQEHLATQITLDQMARLRQFVPPVASAGRSAVVAAVEGEQHMVGARMAADLLEEAGWTVDFLGPNTPAADLIALLAGRRSVELLVLSVTMDQHLPALGPLCAGVRALPVPPKIVVGGEAARDHADLVISYGADYVAADAADTVPAAGRLVSGASAPNPPLERLLPAIGRNILALRTRRGWSQQHLAGAAGLDRTYVSAVERGRQNLSVGALLNLARALDAPIADLLTLEAPRA